MVLSCIICEIKRGIDRKSWFFSYPLAFDASVRGSPSEYCHPVWCGKTRMVGLRWKKIEDMYNGLDTIYRRVTDRQTDRQTSCDGIVRATHTRRAIKTNLKKDKRTTTYKAESRGWPACGQVGRKFGSVSLRRVCQVWQVQGSTLYCDRPSRETTGTSPWQPASAACLRRLCAWHSREATVVNS